MNPYRELINKQLTTRENLSSEILSLQQNLQSLQQEAADISEMQDIARKAANLVQDDLATKLSGIVTKAIKTVFAEDIEFVAEFVERRSVSECDLYLKDGEYSYDILRSRGGGLADVISSCLQLSFILLSDVDRVLVADELCRHMSTEAQTRFAQVLKHLASEFGFTLILVTHAEPFIDVADKVFRVTQTKGVSHVSEL